MKQETDKSMKLLEVFKDFALEWDQKIKNRDGSITKTYKRTIKPKRYPRKRLASKLKKMVKTLQEQYAKLGYVLNEETHDEKRYLVLKRLGHREKIKQVSVYESVWDLWMRSRVHQRIDELVLEDCSTPPLYYEVSSGRFYVPEKYVSKQPQLVTYVVQMRLRPLGVC